MTAERDLLANSLVLLAARAEADFHPTGILPLFYHVDIDNNVNGHTIKRPHLSH
jgi:hypothetical protein